MQKGQTHAVGTQYAVGTKYAVGVSAKRSTHTLDLANMGGGDCYLCYLYCKKVIPNTVRYAVGVGAKRSTHTVYVANMGGGDHYLSCKKVKPHAVRM